MPNCKVVQWNLHDIFYGLMAVLVNAKIYFFMVFHVRWILLTTSLRIPPDSRLRSRVGFRDKWCEKLHLTWKTIYGFVYKMHFLAYFTLQDTLVMLNTLHAKLKIMKIMWDGFISQLFSTFGKIGSMRERLLIGYKENGQTHMVIFVGGVWVFNIWKLGFSNVVETFGVWK